LTVGGEQVGWHCLLANGYDPAMKLPGKPAREMVRLQNSWGTGYGDGGLAWITMDALWDLLSEDGSDAVVAVGRKRLN
jgi:C1A family cysteine protease